MMLSTLLSRSAAVVEVLQERLCGFTVRERDRVSKIYSKHAIARAVRRSPTSWRAARASDEVRERQVF